MARFMLATSEFQVSGCAAPSSKKERGIVAAWGRLKPGFVKEVADASTGVGPAAETDKWVLINGSVGLRAADAVPAIESMDGDGEIPKLASPA